jgi:hypothetical protein
VSQDYIIGPRGPGGTSNAGHGAALYLPNRVHPSVTIFNTGQTTVFVDDEDPLTAPSIGLPLTAGSSLPWDANRALYMTCPTQGFVTITGNSGIPFDAGAVAAQILTQGLAQDIANAIFITGTPPVDKYTLVADSGSFTGVYSSLPMLDTTGYQSLNFVFELALAAVPGQLTATWYAAPTFAASDVIGFDEIIVGTGFITSATLPVRGPWCFIQLDAGAGGGQLKSYASYKAVADAYYFGSGFGQIAPAAGVTVGSGSQGMQNWSGNIPVGTTWTWQPDVVAGPQQLVMRYTNTSAVTLLLRVPITIYPLVTYAAETALPTVNGQMNLYERFLPPIPLELSLQNTHATNTLNFRATLSSARPYSG